MDEPSENPPHDEKSKEANEGGNPNQSEMSTKEAYFASLAEWAKQAAIQQNAMAMFPYYLMANYPQLFQSPTASPGTTAIPSTPFLGFGPQTAVPAPGAAAATEAAPAAFPPSRPAFNRFRLLDEQQQRQIINTYGGYQYVLAPFWKRALAEAIDMLMLFVLKIIVTFGIVNFFDLDFDQDVMRRTLDEEDIFFNFFDISMDFLSLSSNLLFIELLTKLIVCVYEAIWTVFYNGATPGKSLMKIRIHYVEAVFPLQVAPQFVLQPREPIRALLFPAETPGLIRAFMRALAKNLVMTLLFPICIVMVFFKNNRTAYDMITKTIVVETNSNATFRNQIPPQARVH
ncbi:protein FAM8A1 [Drosophila tropicalis]|uniref:protein FAM8A1 n=1 Tax=Drosophila tropicalis TaxID=46794 RepID=UPI0035ABAD83